MLYLKCYFMVLLFKLFLFDCWRDVTSCRYFITACKNYWTGHLVVIWWKILCYEDPCNNTRILWFRVSNHQAVLRNARNIPRMQGYYEKIILNCHNILRKENFTVCRKTKSLFIFWQKVEIFLAGEKKNLNLKCISK